jgi:hypothetical protein
VAVTRGWCHAHYMRWYQYGDVRADVPLKRQLPGSPVERFEAYTERVGACRLWTGRLNRSGYGVTTVSGRSVLAHRWSYEHFVGPIPEGVEPDHLCRNRACVEPIHLELVTHRENVLRGKSVFAEHARKTHCSQGHEFTPENTYRRGANGRGCRECNRIRCQASHQRRKASRSG